MKRKICGLLGIGILFCSLNVWTAQGGRRLVSVGGAYPGTCPSGDHPYCSACSCYGDEGLVKSFFDRYPQAAIACRRKIEADYWREIEPKKPIKTGKFLHPRLVELYTQAYTIEPDDEDALQPVLDAISGMFGRDVMGVFLDVLDEDDGDLEAGVSALTEALTSFEEADASKNREKSAALAEINRQEKAIENRAIQEVVEAYRKICAVSKDMLHCRSYVRHAFSILNPVQRKALNTLLKTRIVSLEQLHDLVKSHFVSESRERKRKEAP